MSLYSSQILSLRSSPTCLEYLIYFIVHSTIFNGSSILIGQCISFCVSTDLTTVVFHTLQYLSLMHLTDLNYTSVNKVRVYLKLMLMITGIFSIQSSPGADFKKGLKSRFRFKLKTLVLNFVKRILSLWS